MFSTPDLSAAWHQLALWLAAAFANAPARPNGGGKHARAALLWLERIARRLVVLEALERLAGGASPQTRDAREPARAQPHSIVRPIGRLAAPAAPPRHAGPRGFQLVERARSVPGRHPAANRRPRITLMTSSAIRAAPRTRSGDRFAERLAALQAVIAAPERTIRRAMRRLMAGRSVFRRPLRQPRRWRGLDPLLIARAEALDHDARRRLARPSPISPPPWPARQSPRQQPAAFLQSGRPAPAPARH